MASWKEDIIKALQNLGGEAALNQIYEEVSKIRPDSASVSYKSFTAIVRGTIENNSADSAKFKESRENTFYSVNGVGKGYWGIVEYIKTPKAVDISIDLTHGNPNPLRTKLETYRILRDSNLAKQVKRLYNNKCQICNLTINLKDGQFYSEAHHVIPLGSPHNGPDTADNILVLCPNHHVMLDYGAYELKLDELTFAAGHILSLESLNYHNETILNNSVVESLR